MREAGKESNLPKRRGDEGRQLLARRDALDSAEADLGAKRRQRAVVRVVLGGAAGTKMVSELVQGADPLTTILLSAVILVVFLVPVELSWRPIIGRLEGLVATLRAEVGRIADESGNGPLEPGTGV